MILGELIGERDNWELSLTSIVSIYIISHKSNIEYIFRINKRLLNIPFECYNIKEVRKLENSIIMYRDYGDIVFDIKKVMDEKAITINQIVKKTGLHHQVVRRY